MTVSRRAMLSAPLLRVPVLGVPVLLAAGCAVPSHHARLTAMPRGGGGVLLMPPDIELAEVSAGGVLVPKADWTDAARGHLDTALDAEKTTRNLRMARFDDSKLPRERQQELDQVQRLHGAVGRAILRYHYIPQQGLPTKQGRFDWTLGTAAQELKQATGADHALFIWIRDSYTSAGRVAVQFLAAALFGVAIPGGVQVGFASLVDVSTGEIVWFNRLARGTGDLRTAPAAAETAKVLLTGFPA